MNFVEDIQVSEEGAEAGFRAEIDRFAAIFEAWEIRRIGIAEFPTAEGDKAWEILLFRVCIHSNHSLAKVRSFSLTSHSGKAS